MSTLNEGWAEEQRSAYLYRVLAHIEAGNAKGELFEKLAQEAEGQAAIWLVAPTGEPPPHYRPDFRARMVAALLRLFGPRALLTALAAMKVRGLGVYAPGESGHGSTARGETRHRDIASGGNLRAAVFGINDGLVSNASLILGVAGASPDPRFIVIAGVAGMMAGAFAMAAGEYVSVRSQRELFEYQIGLEREELERYPEAEAEELAMIYEAKGASADEARDMATRLIADPEKALDTLAREELGLNPEALGSPWGAALSSLLAFATGGLVPLLPFLAGAGDRALPFAIALTGVALFVVGAALSLFTGRHAMRGGLRMLAVGALAGGVTYGLGKVFGVAVG
jgi:VIT1/CCC1 family predicted Fe2+/Mn2+ transporter